MEVELLVCAHDCFTVGCHMEGVSSLLRMARIVTEHLTMANEYNLMVSIDICYKNKQVSNNGIPCLYHSGLSNLVVSFIPIFRFVC